MNYRIRSLAIMAGAKTDAAGRPCDYSLEGSAAVEQFAQAIIEECIRVAELKEQGYGDFNTNISVGWYIRQTLLNGKQLDEVKNETPMAK